ncbi:MAG: imidazolonepropionase [Robiginitomaculum sp.]|nr:imidazolonepropionase [Robiginitomaculum sp.]
MNPNIDAPYGAIEDGALGVKDGRIVWVGKTRDLPEYEAEKMLECDGDWMTPGLVDCHTHLVFGGNRAQEFEQRLQGVSYAEIAKAGGGILSTVKATQEMNANDLYQDASTRLIDFLYQGVTTIEVKSGYGLDVSTEVKMLEVARKLTEDNVRVRTTFLGAHALPPEYRDNPDAYIDLVCNEMIPKISKLGLADAVDGFCENIGFNPAQIRRVFEAAKKHGLPVKLHAEQLSNQGGAKLAAEFGALSADHLEYIDEDSVKAMAEAGTVAVLLPGAFYYLKETQKPPVDLFRKYGVSMALATDCNPGSSPITSPLLILNMACTLFGFTPEEALAGMTRMGAKALGLNAETGTLEVGKSADLAIWEIDHPAELSYWVGDVANINRFYKGVNYE